jgi:branched-chain amino acid transport system ATP-binding protein
VIPLSVDVAVEPVLALRDVTAGYGRTTVLTDVTVEVPPRTVVAVMGANGAGKTTLLRVASGLLRPTRGEVRLGGRVVTSTSTHRRARSGLCAVPEGRGTFPDLTVRENLLLQSTARRPDLDEVLDAFPVLRRRLDQRAGSLSGGEQQMLALSRCWVSEPDVVLLDEVSMGLAPIVVDEVYHALDRLVLRGLSVVLVEQYVHRALALADQVYVLGRGVVTYQGPTAGIDEDDLVRHYLGGQGTD